VYLLNSVTGRVIYKFSETDVDFEQPVRALYSEHRVVVTFTRDIDIAQSKQQEISVTEMYKSKIEDDTQRLLKEAYLNNQKFSSPYFSSFSEESPITVKENFVFPQQIKSLTLT
jgi:hypothetical protein